MLLRRGRVRIRQRPRKQLQRHPPLKPKLKERPRHIQDREVSAAVLFKREQPRIPRPAHARWLPGDMKRVVLVERGGEALPVDDLDVEDFLDVDTFAETLQRGGEIRLCVGCFAGGCCWVRVHPAREVECVEAEAEVGAVGARHRGPGLLPGGDVGAPCEGLVDEAERRALGGAEVCDALEVGDDDIQVAGSAGCAGGWVRREEIGGDLDEVGVEDVGDLEPFGELFGEEVLGLRAVEETLEEEEGLQADDGEAEEIAQPADLVRGGEVAAVEAGMGQAVEIVEEELDAFVAVPGSLMELGGQVVDSWPAQGHRPDS